MSTATYPVTYLPKVARNACRAFVKGLAGFDGWLASRHPGVASRDATNGMIIDAARELGAEHELAALIDREVAKANASPAAPASFPLTRAPVSPVVPAIEGNSTMPAATAPAFDPAVIDAVVEADVRKALAPLLPMAGMLSETLRNELKASVRPFVEAAHKPPVTVTVEKIVEREIHVPALAPLAPGAAPYATKEGKARLGSLFGFRGRFADIEVTTWSSKEVPVDKDYVPHAETIALAATAVETEVNVWLAGPAATGKTSLPQELAARMGRPFVCISFSKHSSADDLIGAETLKGAGENRVMAWSDGVLLQAVRRPGTIILLDEITACPPGIAMILQGLTSSHRSFTVPVTGERVTCAPGVAFFAADNTRGFGDETGAYHGTQPANAALVSRFERMIEMDYLSPSDEAKAMSNRTTAPLAACRLVAELFAKARKLPGLESIPLSLRGGLGFVRMTQQGFSVEKSWEVAVLNRIPDQERAAVRAAIKAHFVEADYAAALSPSGTASPVLAPVADSDAAKAFDDEQTAAMNR